MQTKTYAARGFATRSLERVTRERLRLHRQILDSVKTGITCRSVAGEGGSSDDFIARITDDVEDAILGRRALNFQAKRQGYLRSRQSTCHADDSVTLVTQLSLDRLERLEEQCAHWRGPISAAVYVPGDVRSSSLETVLAPVEAAWRNMEESTECALDISVLHGLHPAEADQALGGYDLEYPINALRNLALACVRSESEHVFLVDVDFVSSDNLQELVAHAVRNERHRIAPIATVVPAFEASAKGHEDLPRTKSEVRARMATGHISGFHMANYPRGHRATCYERWLATDGTCCYDVDYEEGFEPFIVATRKFIPQFEERFRGYGYNKVSFLWHLSALGFAFEVLPNAFICAHEHPRSRAWERLYGESSDEHILCRARVETIFDRFRQKTAAYSVEGLHSVRAPSLPDEMARGDVDRW